MGLLVIHKDISSIYTGWIVWWIFWIFRWSIGLLLISLGCLVGIFLIDGLNGYPHGGLVADLVGVLIGYMLDVRLGIQRGKWLKI
jgi:hypothetical protein